MSKTVLLRLICIALLAAEAVQPATSQVRYPWVYPGNFRERVKQADLVVSGTIGSTVPKTTRVVDGVEVTSNRASIAVDRVFKGGAYDPTLYFVWYSPASVSGGVVYSGPPFARFVAGKRYLVFLRKEAAGYVVTVAPQSGTPAFAPASPLNLRDISVLPDDVRDSEIAQELETAALSIDPPAPGVTGWAAVYFPYVVDLSGGCAKPFLQHLPASPSKALRDVAQRWLALLVDKHMRCKAATYHER